MMKSPSDPLPLTKIFWNLCGIFMTVCFGFWAVVLLNGAVQTSYSQRHVTTSPIQVDPETTDAPLVHESSVPADGKTHPVTASAPTPNDTSAGQKVYNTVCMGCHQPSGQGLPGMFPPLAESDWVSAPKPDRLIRIVLHGLMGPITINGEFFKTPAPMMPPQGAALSDEQIAQVITYIRNTWGGQPNAVTTDEVSAIRNKEKGRSMMWTADELANIDDQ
jgi:mono/diheme cytochrome c family protein